MINMINTLGLVNKVKLHLTYAIMWSNITTLKITDVNTRNNLDGLNSNNTTLYILKGENPKCGQMEYVFTINKRTKLTIENLDLIFMKIEQTDNQPVQSVDKILIAIVDSDGSILFYYVHRGVKNFTD